MKTLFDWEHALNLDPLIATDAAGPQCALKSISVYIASFLSASSVKLLEAPLFKIILVVKISGGQNMNSAATDLYCSAFSHSKNVMFFNKDA